jgi:DNA-binding MarR family transcriptional regulator
MSSRSSRPAAGARAASDRGADPAARQKLASDVRAALRALRVQLSLLNNRVRSQIDLRDVDLDFFDIIDTDGPISPSELARRTGQHPATVTGILDRLERGGWIARERDPSDRRAVRVAVVRERYGDLIGLYHGMARAMNKLLASYTEQELAVIADFLQRTVEAGEQATEELAATS